MSLFYALISKNYDNILSEYTSHTGNFQQITRILLFKLKSNHNNIDKIGVINYNKYVYSYIIDQNIIYLCLSHNLTNEENISIDSRFNNDYELYFAFLDDIKKYFNAEFSQLEIEKLKSYEIPEFDKTLNLLMNYYNERPTISKSGLYISSILENKNVKVENINNYLDNYELVNIVVLEEESYNQMTITKKNLVLSEYIQQKEKIKNIKFFLKIAVCVLIILYFLYLVMK